ncbi:MAG: Cro/Cl family transcriptional regulator [Pseudomonas sp.]
MQISPSAVTGASLARGFAAARNLNSLPASKPTKTTAELAATRFVRTCGGIALALWVGTGGAATPDGVTARDARGYRLNDIKYTEIPASAAALKPRLRTPTENLAYVRSTLKPAVTELAQFFGVSRQAIYNWQAGESISRQKEHLLRELACAASLLQEKGLTNSPSLLKRKIAGGKTLLELMHDGESGQAAAMSLISLATKEEQQRSSLESRLKHRNRPAVELDAVGAPYFDARA